MSMFGYNTLGFGSIAGTAPVTLDLTLQGGSVSRTNATYTGVSIGTANTNRMVIIQGAVSSYGSITAPTSITLNGTAMTLVRNAYNVFIAYLKVPTGTTATIVISGGGGAFNQQIITINTVNAGANQTSIQSGSAAGNGGSLTHTMTTDPVTTNGVFIWGGNGFNGIPNLSLLTSNPSGATTTLSYSSGSGGSNNAMLMGYSECTTADSRNAQIRNTNTETSGKVASALYSVFTYFQTE
mgnify:CR=1 FL=1